MPSNGSKFSAGPKPMPGDKLVRIIFVPLEVASGGISGGGQVSLVGLQQIAAHVGTISSTDIVVFAGKPFHYAKGALHGHETAHHDHPETLLKLHRLRKERAVWWSQRSFAITTIRPEEPVKAGAAPYPFETKPLTEAAIATDAQKIFVARSSIPLPTADDQEYKIAFTIEGESEPIDPNMYCDPNP